MRRHHVEEDEHSEGQGQGEEAEQDQEQDQAMWDVEDAYEPPHQQPYVEHETGAESWANHEAFYEQQQHNFYEPQHSPQPQPQDQPQPQPPFVFDFRVLQEQQQQSLKALTDL
ncbi:hypothetical protein PIB30_089376, partial [Stylosanthes scabra]|nr:hypothetical protein [Stylosanthes scabra]